MAEYPAEVLKKLQSIEVDMLEVFVSICAKYNINYFVTYGTALGCFRHQGFIPWDDDIDVGILWEDYKKLRSVPKEEWGGKIVLCDPLDANENHYYPYPRLYRLGTTLLPDDASSLRDRKRNNTGIACNGLWIDLFIFHRFQSLEEIKRTKERAITLRRKYMYSKKEKVVGMEEGIPRKIIALWENTYSKFVNLTRREPEKRIWQKYESIFEEKGDWITTVDCTYNNCPERTMLKECDLFPLKEARFDRLTVKVPKEANRNLRNIYGDYMKLPPLEKRINHAPTYLDFGDGDVIKMQKENGK